jgi:hypothetical protein
VKSLGVTLDRQLSFDQHVDNVCKACYFHIRALRHVRDSLPQGRTEVILLEGEKCKISQLKIFFCQLKPVFL